MARAVAALAVVLSLAACHPSSAAQPRPLATPETVGLQPGDVVGLKRCEVSGDINTVLLQEKSSNPLAYDLNATEWEQWRTQGALQAYYAVYGRTAADCAALTQAGTGAPTGGLMAGLVVQFKDDAIAARNFGAGSTLFGFGPRDMTFIKLAGGSITSGAPTGLGDQSAVGAATIQGNSYYFAFWQKKRFDSFLVAYDVASGDAQVAASDVNGRIY